MEILQAISDLAAGLGTLFLGTAALIALYGGFTRYERAKLKVEKQGLILRALEHNRRLKFDTAVEAVQAFRKFKANFDIIRSSAVREGESKRLADMPDESELIKSAKKHTDGGIVLLRMDERDDVRKELVHLQPRFFALFEDEEPFETALSVWHEVQGAAMIMAQGGSKLSVSSKAFSAGPNDEISAKVDRAVKRIHELCHPVLHGDLKKLFELERTQ